MLLIITLMMSCMLIGVESQTESQAECNEEDDNPCGMAEVDEIMSNLDELPSEEFLRKNCRKFQEAVPCHLEQMKSCHQISDSDPYFAEFEGYLALLNAVCNEESSLRQEYLGNVTCYNSILGKLGDCLKDMKQLMDLFIGQEESTTKTHEERHQDERKAECIRMNIVVNCYVRKAADACGMQSALTLSQLIHLGTDPLVTALCPREKVEVYLDELLSYLVNNGDEIRKSKDKFSENFTI